VRTLSYNRRQTLAVLRVIGAEASTFERLSLCGRMLKRRLPEIRVDRPDCFGRRSAARWDRGIAGGGLASRSKSRTAPAPTRSWDRRLVWWVRRKLTFVRRRGCPGNNLVRWLTALPPTWWMHAAIATTIPSWTHAQTGLIGWTSSPCGGSEPTHFWRLGGERHSGRAFASDLQATGNKSARRPVQW